MTDTSKTSEQIASFPHMEEDGIEQHRQPTSPSKLAIRGWSSRLAGCVSGGLLILAATGLWLYLMPFSVASQFQLILHVAIGLLAVVPCLYYQGHHIATWYRQKVTASMLMGYALTAVLMLCLLSGIVLTWRAAAGPRLPQNWDVLHLLSGFVATGLIVSHLTSAFLRRRQSARSDRLLAAAQRTYAIRIAALIALAGIAVAASGLAWPGSMAEKSLPESYRLSKYSEQFEEYRGSPFAPSYATTAGQTLVDPSYLSGSSSCGTAGCHEQILAEWEPSAHRFSAMNPSFQQIQRNFAADRGPEETRYCAGCHDPISLFAGAKDIHNMDLAAPGMQEGCSCVVCHSIAQVDQRGNADYVLVPPRKYVWEGTAGWKKRVSDFLIRAYPRQHLADYDRTLLRTPEFCGACHKQFIPEALNRFGLVAGQNQYDEWRKSHWHADDPAKDLACMDCHMRLVTDSSDPGRGEAGAVRRSRDDGAHRHHGTIATNFLMPQILHLPHWENQVRLTEEWIRGETVIPEIAHLWPAGPVAGVKIIAPNTARAGEEVNIRTVVMNQKAGHNLTTGPLDFMRAWVHLRVVDAQGRTIAEWGAIDPKTRRITDSAGQEHRIGNSRKEGTLVLEGQPIDGDGKPILRHELWTMAGGKGKRVIFPGYSDNHSYIFRVPDSAEGTLRILADFNYRRYRQEFLDLTLPDMENESGVYQPTVAQSSHEARITVIKDDKAGSDPNP